MRIDSLLRVLTRLPGLLLGLVIALDSAAADIRPQPEAASGFEPRPAAIGARFMAVTAHPLATKAATAILAGGGTAVDAAIAAQLVLNVVEPQSSGIGGGGFLLHYERATDRVLVYDGRETAPLAARPDRFLDAGGTPLPLREAVTGGLAVGVPGLVAMLWQAHQAHGRLPWRELFLPAIALAKDGFALTPRLNRLLGLDTELPRNPAARRQFYDAEGRPLPVGARLTNPALAHTLRRLADEGPAAFYQGELARSMVAAVRSARPSGDLSLDDLASYPIRVREALCAPYRGYRVCVPPPPAGGLTLLQILGILAAFPPQDPRVPSAVHRFTEAARLAYADRAHYLADPDFVPVRMRDLLDGDYLAARAGLIRDAASLNRAEPGALSHTAPVEGIGAGRSATTHLSIVDADGNAVALTSSIEDAFGSRLMVNGFLLNNQLTDFAFRPEVSGRVVANRVEGGKRPSSAMTPTLIFDPEGRLYAVLGSPGGSRIIHYVARALVALIDGGLPPGDVVALAHAGSRNGPTELERGRASPVLAEELRARGHEIVFAEMTSGLHLIQRTGEHWTGAADPRREGVADGQ